MTISCACGCGLPARSKYSKFASAACASRQHNKNNARYQRERRARASDDRKSIIVQILFPGVAGMDYVTKAEYLKWIQSYPAGTVVKIGDQEEFTIK